MWIGTLALAGIPFFAGFYSKDAILEAAYGAHTHGRHAIAFWLGIVAAVLTAFYSWRLMFMTFHGEPRADHHTMDHVHESPPVMLSRCSCWRSARCSPGYRRLRLVRRRARSSSGAASILSTASTTTSCTTCTRCRLWVKLLPLVVGVARHRARLLCLHRASPSLPARLGGACRPLYHSSQQVVLRRALRPPVRAARHVRSATCSGRSGDGGIIDGFGPDGVAAATLDAGAAG